MPPKLNKPTVPKHEPLYGTDGPLYGSDGPLYGTDEPLYGSDDPAVVAARQRKARQVSQQRVMLSHIREWERMQLGNPPILQYPPLFKDNYPPPLYPSTPAPGFGGWPPAAGPFFGGTTLPGVKPMGVPPFGDGTPLGNNVRANTRNGNSQVWEGVDSFAQFLGNYNDVALYTGGSMYKVVEEVIKHEKLRGTISSFAAAKFNVNPTAVSNALIRTGGIIKQVGIRVGFAGGIVTYSGAVYKLFRGTDNTSTWVDVTASTIFILGALTTAAPFVLVVGIGYGGYRMFKGKEMDEIIDKKFGYR